MEYNNQTHKKRYTKKKNKPLWRAKQMSSINAYEKAETQAPAQKSALPIVHVPGENNQATNSLIEKEGNKYNGSVVSKGKYTQKIISCEEEQKVPKEEEKTVCPKIMATKHKNMDRPQRHTNSDKKRLREELTACKALIEDIEEEINNGNYSCPILFEIMEDPVMGDDGITYERANIQRWLSQPNSHRKSPINNKRISILIPNYQIKKIIEEKKQKYKLLKQRLISLKKELGWNITKKDKCIDLVKGHGNNKNSKKKRRNKYRTDESHQIVRYNTDYSDSSENSSSDNLEFIDDDYNDTDTDNSEDSEEFLISEDTLEYIINTNQYYNQDGLDLYNNVYNDHTYIQSVKLFSLIKYLGGGLI